MNKLVPWCAWLLSDVLEIPRSRLRLSSGTHADSKLVCVLNAEKDVKINSNYIKINAFNFWNFNIDAAVSNEVAYAWNFSSDVLKPMGTQKLKCLEDISQKKCFFTKVNHPKPPRRDLWQVQILQLPVALQRETPAQYPCCQENFWVVADLKRRYRNGLNERMNNRFLPNLW